MYLDLASERPQNWAVDVAADARSTRPFAGRVVPSYVSGDRQSFARDWRIDVLRGMSLAFLAVNHTSLQTPLSHITKGLFGFVSGAEIFVILAGFLLGSVHRRRFERQGWWAVTIHLWRRASKIYLASLGASAVVFLALWIPFLNFGSVAVEGVLADGRNGYEHSGGVDFALKFITLNTGPWPINILALYVLLMLAAPVAIRFLGVGRWGLGALLALSIIVWALAQASLLPGIPVQGQHAFPVGAWQLIFVIGMAAGWYREALGAFLATPRGRVVMISACVAAVCFVIAGYFAEDSFRYPYGRTTLEFGRVANLLVIVPVACLFLGRIPSAIQRPVRVLFEGTGRASLYVFLVHVVMLALVATVIDIWGDADAALNTVLSLGMLAAIWLMVRYRVLFGVIPR